MSARQDPDDEIEACPPHASVNWNVMKREKHKGRPSVQVTCPGCQAVRFLPAYNVAFKVRWGRFTGRCPSCRIPIKPDGSDRRVLPPQFEPEGDRGSGGCKILGAGRDWLAALERQTTMPDDDFFEPDFYDDQTSGRV